MADTKRARIEAADAGGSKAAAASAGESEQELKYMNGFGNHFSTEALPGALPVGQNSPQRCEYGLYAEQINGTAFTAPRASNRRSWFYRIRPSVSHEPFQPVAANPFDNDFAHMEVDPSQMRWKPLPKPSEPVNFIHGITTQGGVGDPTAKAGLAIYLYACDRDMGDTAFYSSDGEWLIVPQQGALFVRTEMGRLHVAPNEILVIPRGVKFSVDLRLREGEDFARGYILETFEGHYILPDLGPIGSNCLAQPQDFKAPTAWYDDRDRDFTCLNKFGGKLFSAKMDHSCFDVVAWHGNMTPYKYDLGRFICLNSVTKDHPDPSIYTVLTCPSATPGVAVADFVIFPTRWMVMEDTFRPPWYHRNTMTEFMGMIWGKKVFLPFVNVKALWFRSHGHLVSASLISAWLCFFLRYDAKKGFVAGGSSLHSCMSAHGPDAPTFEGASKEKLKPFKFDKGLAFMFETKYQLKLSHLAVNGQHRDKNYTDCWRNLPKKFDGTPGKK